MMGTGATLRDTVGRGAPRDPTTATPDPDPMKTIRTLALALWALPVLAPSARAQSNDDCGSPIRLNPNNFESYFTGGANASVGFFPDMGCGGAGSRDLWYEYTPAADVVRFSVDTCGGGGPSYDSAIQVYRGGGCAFLVPVVCDGGACGQGARVVVDSAGPGSNYVIRVGGRNGASGAGEVVVRVIREPNDGCGGAIPLSSGTPRAFDTRNSTSGSPSWSCAPASRDLWYSYTLPPLAGGFTVDTSGGGGPTFGTALEVFSGDCSGLTSVGCDVAGLGAGSVVTVNNAAPGSTYLIRVGAVASQTSSGEIVVRPILPPACVPNPSFETGDTSGWTLVDFVTPFEPGRVVAAGESPPGFPFFATEPTEGAYAFAIGFDAGTAGTATLSQDVTVSAENATLSFNYRAAWDMLTFGGATLPRTFHVRIRSVSDGSIFQESLLLEAAPGTVVTDTGSRLGEVDLHWYLGQTVRVSFEWFVPEDFTGPGWFQLDNVRCPGFAGAGLGNNLCTAVPNSVGNRGTMSGYGSSRAALNDLSIYAFGLPPNVFGIFFTSRNTGFEPGAGGTSNGNLCLGGPIGRFTRVRLAGLDGIMSMRVELTGVPQGGATVPVVAGDTWYFQAWYRDQVGLGSNFSDSLEVTFH